MKAYIMTIIGATLLSAYASNLAPETWRKYVRIITGLVLIICILSPIKSLVGADLFGDFDINSVSEIEGKTQTELVAEELSERVEADIEERLKNEFGVSAKARVKISVNGKGEITGVKEIRVSGAELTPAAKARLRDVYGVYEVYDE